MGSRTFTPAQAAKIRAKRLEAVAKPLSIACPYCGAGIGELCRTKTGNDFWQIHEPRLRPPEKSNRPYRPFYYTDGA
jgi:hypothetical protein